MKMPRRTRFLRRANRPAHHGARRRAFLGRWSALEQLEPRILLASDPIYRVNAGGPALAGNPSWQADLVSSPAPYHNNSASTFSTTTAINVSHPSIPAGTPAAVFQSERWDPAAAPEMAWSFPVSPGTYEVRLYFADIYAGTHAAGKRVFDVSIEGQLVLDNYDIFAKVGGFAGIVESLTVTSDDKLDILFGHVTENPVIKAIEILEFASPNELAASAQRLDFGNVVVGQSATRSWQLTNRGAAGDPGITIDPAGMSITGPQAGQFTFTFGTGGPVVLGPGESATVDVRYTPTAVSAAAATLAVVHSGINSPLGLPLSGSGITSTAVALVKSAPGGPMEDSTTHSAKSFTITNQSPNGAKIESVYFDLSSTLLTDIVFDPNGQGGDVVAKPFTVDTGGVVTGYQSASLESPHDGGFDALRVTFSDFDPGETFEFSIDIDPTSIKGSPAGGSGHAGAVSGLELMGSVVTVQFSDGASFTSELYRIPGSFTGSQAVVQSGLPGAPSLEILGTSGNPVTVASAAHTARISGPAGATALLAQIEATLNFKDVPGGGFDVDPFETNAMISIVDKSYTIGAAGFVDVPITLVDTRPEGGYNHIVAVLKNSSGQTGPLARRLLEYDSSTAGPPPPPPAASGVLYRVNAGGPALAGNPSWQADTASSPAPYHNKSASTFSTTTAINVSHPSIPAGTPAAVFQSERWDPAAAPEMAWSFPVSPGTYEVRLYFADIYAGTHAAGKRVFDVSIEGQLVLDNYDIFVKVGGFAGIVESLTVTSDDKLDILFGHVTENPVIKAIEILEFASPNELAASAQRLDFGSVVVGQSATRSWQLTNRGAAGDPGITIDPAGMSITGPQAGQFTFTFGTGGPVVLGPGESATVDVRYTPTAVSAAAATLAVVHSGINSPLGLPLSGSGVAATPPPPPPPPPPPAGEILYRVNAGGPAVGGNPSWQADTASSPAPYHNKSASVFSTTTAINVSHPSIPAGTPAAVFQSERWDPAAAPEMAWSFPVSPGAYEVRLYFADIYAGTHAAGKRVFDVSIEGQLVLDNYDIFAKVGGFAGIVESLTVTSDDKLDILFGHVTENPVIKAIEIRSLAQPEPLVASKQVLDFGDVLMGHRVTRHVNVTNNGSGPITIDPNDASITGTHAIDFKTSFPQAGPITLQPGGTMKIEVTFTPSAAAPASAQLAVGHSATGSPLRIGLKGAGANDIALSFGKSSLAGAGAAQPTSIQFGPDGRLYVAQQDGLIKAYTVERAGPNQYRVTGTETITHIQSIVNHDDNGAVNSSIKTRLVTGLLVVGTPSAPVIYVGSSDPRIGAGPSAKDLNLDTNSGILSRLTSNGSGWTRLDLVRGLPRSEENHATNGLQLDPATNTLYVAQGGHTNMGATSKNFAYQPEYALSAAILAIDLDAIGQSTYDLPTLDDENRSGSNDANDPFGGNNGKNQAILVPGGPVRVHSPGYRNAYDLLLTSQGRMYTIDNGPNAGWGDVPVNEGPQGLATNGVNEPGVSYGDGLHYITGPGYYGGHPNPTRSNPANTFNATNPQSPVSQPNPIESDYRIPGAENGALVVYPASTNGLVEYTATNFFGLMQGDLLAASFDNTIKRVKLNAAGTGVVLSKNLFNSVGTIPLDITAVGDTGPFPGTIWVTDIVSGAIIVFEPADYDGSGATEIADPNDLDGDGYTNSDEEANGTNPKSAADVPPDWDRDFKSDLLDNDDDNDLLLDNEDPFALDADNGKTTAIGVSYTWENDSPPAGGLLNLGFTGLMTNGSTDYSQLFDAGKLTAGGAAGVLTLDSISEGDATGPSNNQEQAFQFGVNVAAATKPYVVHSRLIAPFAGQVPQGNQSMGIFLGTGDQDNYLKVVATAGNGNPGITFVKEVGGQVTPGAFVPLALPGPDAIDLYLTVNPNTALVSIGYAATTSSGTGAIQKVGDPVAIPASWINGTQNAALAVGIISTSVGSAPPISATWDLLRVVYEAEPAPPPPAKIVHRVNAGGPAVGGTSPGWAADTAAAPSAYHNTGSNVSSAAQGIKVSHASIPAGTPASLFQTERWDPPSGAEMQWSFPVTPGPVEVSLYFAETYSQAQAKGKRLFDVQIEGMLVLDNYDIFADVGGFAGVVKTFTVASDSTLNIVFGHVVENPSIRAIEIRELPIEPNEPPALEPLADVMVEENRSTSIPVRATDPDGDAIKLSAAGLPIFATLADAGDGTGTLVVTPSIGDAGTYRATIRATDDRVPAKFSEQAVTIIVDPLDLDTTVAMRINAGGPTLAGSPDWQADTVVTPPAAQMVAALDIGNRLELFVDNYLIDSMVGAGFQLHVPTEVPATAGAHAAGAYPSVLFDGTDYRHYYRGYRNDVTVSGAVDGTNKEVVRFGTSSNGTAWTQPALNLLNVVVDGANNVVLANDAPSMHNFSAMLDTRPGASPQQRYKALAGVSHVNGTLAAKSGLRAYASPDGIHWTLMAAQPVITLAHLPAGNDSFAFDSANVPFWSETEQKYVVYYRTWRPHPSGGSSLRSISRAVSNDFITWTNHTNIQANFPGEHLYTSTVSPYFRAPHLYTAMPTQFLPNQPNDNTRVLFMTSRNGTKFDRIFGQQTFIHSLPGNRQNYVAPQIHQTGANEMSIYGQSGARYTLRLDGFSSVDTTGKSGEMTTKLVRFTGDRLDLNLVTGAGGFVKVEIQDERGQPIPGFTLAESDGSSGDGTAIAATWKGSSNLASLAGRPVRLRFVMQNADLYAMRFAAIADQIPSRLSVPQSLNAAVGATIAVPIQLSVNDPDGIVVKEVSAALSFDPSRFSVSNVRAGSALAGYSVQSQVDAVAGTLVVTASGSGVPLGPLSLTDLVLADFTVRSGALLGATPVNLLAQLGGTTTGLDGGQLPLSAPPTSSPADPVDGKITVTGSYYNAGAQSSTATTGTAIKLSHPSIPAGTPAGVFNSERWDGAGGTHLQWEIPVRPGQYLVRLYFSDNFIGTHVPGARVFDIAIENQVVLRGFDIYAQAGGFAGIVKSFLVTSDDRLDIDLHRVVHNPTIGGIEILSVSGGGGEGEGRSSLAHSADAVFGNASSLRDATLPADDSLLSLLAADARM